MVTVKRTRKPKAESASKASAAPVAKYTNRAADMTESIRYRAYELYERRGRTHGHDFEDWIRAESEVLGQSRTA
jgi:hypothetical protein